MRKKILFLILSLFLVLPFSVNAEEAVTTSLIQPRDQSLIEPRNAPQEENDLFAFDDNLNVSGYYDGTSFMFGNQVTHQANVSGINFVAGNNINIEGYSEYSFVAGNMISYAGETTDLFVAGNMITLTDKASITRDMYAAGESIVLSGSINRNLSVVAKTVELKDVTIAGNVKIDAAEIKISDEVIINGTLKYNEDAKVTGNVEKYTTETYASVSTQTSFATKVVDALVKIAGTLLVALVVCFVMPKTLENIEKLGKEIKTKEVFIRLAIGFGVLILTPIVLVLLLASTIGMELALITFIIYFLVVYLSIIISSYFVGNLLLTKVLKKENNKVISMAIGVLVLSLISYIPFIGGIINFILMLFGLGIIFKLIFYKKA